MNLFAMKGATGLQSRFRIRSSTKPAFDFQPRRAYTRRPATPPHRRAAVVRHRGYLAEPGISTELLGAWAVQGGIVLTMLGIVAFFRVPLMATLGAWF